MNPQSLVGQVFNQQQNKITHLQQKVDHLQQQLASCKRTNKDQSKQIDDLYKQLQQKQQIITNRHDQIKKLEQNLKQSSKTNAAQMVKVISFVEQEQSIKKNIIQLSSNYQLQTEIKILNLRNEDIIDQRNSLEYELNQINQLKHQNSKLMNKVNQYFQQNTELRLQYNRILVNKQNNSSQQLLKQFQQSVDEQSKLIVKKYEQEKQSLKIMISQLKDIVDSKNKVLEKYDMQLIQKLSELQNMFPKNNRDQIQSIKNAIKFMSEQLKNKVQTIREINQKYKTFQEYNQKNNQLIKRLNEEIRVQANQIEFLKKQNQNISKDNIKRGSINGNLILEKEIEELKYILNELLWENQACHILLYNSFGQNFKYSLDTEKDKLKQEFKMDKNKRYGAIDNRYLTVNQLVQKNNELAKELNKFYAR